MLTGHICDACAGRIRELEEEVFAWRSAGQTSLREGKVVDRLARYARRLQLSPGNATVLLAFVDHPDKVRTREVLLDLTAAFENDGGDRGDRAIDTRVKHVRKALAKARLGGNRPIETLYGLGYVMAPDVAAAIREAVGA